MFSKFFVIQRQIARCIGTFTTKETQCPTVDRSALDSAVKKLYGQPARIPVAIGNQMIFTGDEQNVYMPHNHHRIATKFYYATKNHINFAIQEAIGVQETWSNMDVKQRAGIFYKAADMLSVPEKRIELMAAIILNQAKTAIEAENDVCKLILMIRKFSDGLLNLCEMEPPTVTSQLKSSYLLRPLDGFVAACGPLYMSWNASYLALSPLIMGNSVIWRPPPNYVHAAFILFKAFLSAGVPLGAFQFLPSNYKLFLSTVIESNDLAGINYAGRVDTLRGLWHNLSIRLPHYKCFPRLVGECDSKGFHFVHESADMDLVVEQTLHAAFRNSGQRTHSCGRLYVPSTVWPQICCELQSAIKTLKIGDPSDENTYASAIMREDVYDDIAVLLDYAKCEGSSSSGSGSGSEILIGGNFTKTHGFFIEPTIVLCRDPTDRMMIEEIMGPVLCVHVYDNCKLEDALQTLKDTQKFGNCGSIYSTNGQVTIKLLNKLRMTASNLYVNEECCGPDLSYLPLSGNRLSGTNDKSSPEYYLLRFASPQLIEHSVEDEVNAEHLKSERSSC